MVSIGLQKIISALLDTRKETFNAHDIRPPLDDSAELGLAVSN